MSSVGDISWSWILGDRIQVRKKNLLPCVNILHKMSYQEISHPSRAVAAKKCTKKCKAGAWELLFGYWANCIFNVLVATTVIIAKSP